MGRKRNRKTRNRLKIEASEYCSNETQRSTKRKTAEKQNRKEHTQNTRTATTTSMIKRQQTRASISRLTNDIVVDILSRLPIKTLSKCRCVCKSWHNLIQSPRFAKLHLHKASQRSSQMTSLIIHNSSISRYLANQYHPNENHPREDLYLFECEHYKYDDSHSDDDDDDGYVTAWNTQFNELDLKYKFVGSCNGLLCLSEPVKLDPVYVCNPIIGEYMTLPPVSEKVDYQIISGFGFDAINDQYKVIRMRYRWIDRTFMARPAFELVCEIYTIGSGGWREIGNVPYPLSKRVPVFFNGGLHWITDCFIRAEVSGRIVCFEVSSEQFRVLPAPPGYQSYSEGGPKNHSLELGILGGRICLFDSYPNNYLLIWVMKEYGMKESWTKEYVVRRPEVYKDVLNLKPLTLTNNGKILFLCSDIYLMCYDPVTKGFQFLYIDGLPPRFTAINYVGSLVSLRNAGRMARHSGSLGYGTWSTSLFPVPRKWS